MKGIICAATCGKSIDKFLDIVDGYEAANIPIKEYHLSRSNSYAEFQNGDSWRVIPGTPDKIRGHRANIVYIDNCFSQEIKNEIIIATLTIPPYKAFYVF